MLIYVGLPSTQGGVDQNAQNIRWEPGAVYDSVLQLVQQPPPLVDFDQEIQSNRSFAEQSVGIPDFGIGDQSGSQGQNKTATETNAITQVMQQSNDLRARIIKNAITIVFEQSWSILRQYKKDDLDYFWRKERITLEDAALDNAYVLRPNGSVDGYSREKETQKLMQLRQMAAASPAPWIKLWEIDRKIIELVDAQWIDQVYQEPQDAQADQQFQQAIENSVMIDGFLPPVLPTDDHVAHLTIMEGFIGWSQTPTNGVQIGQTVMPTFLQHGTNHVQAARSDPAYMKQYGPQIAQFANKIAASQKQLQQAQAAQQQAGTAMSNLRGMTPAPPAFDARDGSRSRQECRQALERRLRHRARQCQGCRPATGRQCRRWGYRRIRLTGVCRTHENLVTSDSLASFECADLACGQLD